MNIGGPAIHASLLTERLDPARYETRLVTGTTGPSEGNYLDLIDHDLPNMVDVPALGREISPWHDVAAYRQIRQIIEEFRPHIVHTHTAKAGLIGRMAARNAGVPVIVHTFHGHVLRGYFSRVREAMFVAAERALARSTTRLVAVSEQVREDLLSLGVGRREQYEIVRLGLDLRRYAATTRTGTIRNELQLTQDAEVIGIVARLVPIKAHDVFLDMAARVARARPRATFLIVGDGECRAALERATDERGLSGRVHFLGWRRDLDQIYADLDVVVLTSRNEGSPVALIEAMASGRPVVSTRVGGVPELVGDGGLLADVDDADGLARQVERVLDDPALASALGARGRLRAIPAFSGDRLVADIDALYQRLLAGAGRPRAVPDSAIHAAVAAGRSR